MTVLHLCAVYNLTEAINSLEDIGIISKLVNMAVKLTGYTPLHFAAVNDSSEAVAQLLQHQASLSSKLILCKSTPAHLAAQVGAWKSLSLLCHASAECLALVDGTGVSVEGLCKAAGVMGQRFLSNNFHSPGANASNTVLVTCNHCVEHHTCPPSQLRTPSAPPENVHRLRVLIDEKNGVLRASDISRSVKWIDSTSLAPISDVLRVHEWMYARKVQERCSQIGIDPEQEDGLDSLDADTSISRGTFNAALGALGAVCRAIDEVVMGNAKNAFCPVRPPGHHAGPNGAVKGGAGSDSHGFCIFNNVSVGASYAMNRYRDVVKKVAIVDFGKICSVRGY